MATIPTRLAWIDACRGAAATAVVLYHTARHFDKNYGLPTLNDVFRFGHAGVDLFFVISGFVILFVHFDDIGQRGRIWRYLERRVTRVLPAYWVALALTVGLASAAGHGSRLADVVLSIVPVPTMTEPILGIAWTLQYEFVFYAVFAVLVLSRRGGATVMLAWLAVTVFGAARTDALAVPGAFYGIFNLEFFAGMAVAYRLRRGGLSRYATILAAGAILFAAAAVAEDLGWMDGYAPFARLAYGLPSTLVVLGAAEASRRGGARVPAALQTLGAASYSLYLFHFLLIGVAWKLWLAAGLAETVPPGIGFVLFSTVAIVGGVMISRAVEYPLMHVIRRILHGQEKHKAFAVAPGAPLP